MVPRWAPAHDANASSHPTAADRFRALVLTYKPPDLTAPRQVTVGSSEARQPFCCHDVSSSSMPSLLTAEQKALSIDEQCQTQPPSAILFTKNACGPVIETTTVQKLAEDEGLSASLRSLCNPAAVLEVLNVLTRSAPDLMQIAKGGTPGPDGAILQEHGISDALANFVSEGGSIRTPGGLASPHSCVVATAADKTKVEIVVNQMKNAQQRIGDVSREVCMRSRLPASNFRQRLKLRMGRAATLGLRASISITLTERNR